MKNLKNVIYLLFGLLALVSSCEDIEENECLQLSFTQDGKELFADFDGINDLDVYEWFVDDQLVETESLQNERDNKLDLSSYNPGTYTVCIKAETETCPEGVEFCKEITIEEPVGNEDCPSLAFTVEGGVATASFEGIDEIDVYEWFVDGQVVETESNQNQDRDNKLDLSTYNPGEYNVCIKFESPECPQGVEFCKVVVIEDDNTGGDNCPDLSFIEEGTLLFASFPGIDQLDVYEWFVDGQLVETEDLQSQDRDDMLDLGSYNPGTYKVCIKAETNECAQGTEFCLEVVIPMPQPVDCNAFNIIYASSGNREFVARNPLVPLVDPSTVVWTIDGNQVPSNSPTGNFIILDDHLTQPGKYEVCYKGESQDCGTLEKCIEVDFLAL
ncbi:hypothetical protein [Aquimarina spongiae]|uniref:Uncharacterized protein n=1 Tax=Aquimarina spongiae TaxID=570521 RepID=A0A1M6CZN7_9FLAO|nr:hypothetical protein [Aquimarina spongiae]SHI66492.1 hypothetical protein SAMN04488508_102365 [Aquimarina spongiae]